ncbi:hypothetical protein ACPDXS_003506 [Vibrio cholerae]|uniref:hypothetical protein n=1 Tax=unclassified Vibrio TaxID=2614977 RepID=UPI000D0BE82C|nr:MULTISPECIES: hypothetical protein [unclassified Vibrio]NAX19118.1 hypothetical protein [Vibrio sp. V22_P2S10T140]PSD43247.1 hypothetical protein C7E22_01495 [Vibrio sp. V02_P2A34T13]
MVQDLNDFLDHVNLAELHSKIGQFRDLDFKSMSYQDVQKAVSRVISFDTPEGNRALLTPAMASYPKGTRFYRVRNIPANDRNLPLKSMSKVSDCWEPPQSVIDAGHIKAGRLNRANEALIYTTPGNPNVAVEELKVNDGELFSLIVYEALEDIKVVCIGIDVAQEHLSEQNKLKHTMLQDFLKHEFIRDVGIGTEYLYRISESIIKDYFDLPPEWQDGWCYPSVAKKGGFYNVCFRPSIKRKVKLVGTQIANVKRIEKDYLFSVKLIAADLNSDGDLEYYDVGSDAQKQLFPEIRMS